MIMNDFLGNELDIQTVTRPYKKNLDHLRTITPGLLSNQILRYLNI